MNKLGAGCVCPVITAPARARLLGILTPVARAKSIRKRRFVEPERAPDAPLDDLVEDGLLIANAGVRMTVRNLIIVRALRDGADYDEGWYVDAVKHEFRALAAEKRADAERVAADHDTAMERPGRASHVSDYRSRDAPTLDRRSASLFGVADRLEAEGEDDELATVLVQIAREAALDEIASAIGPSVQPSADYLSARKDRMELVARDLAMLQLGDPDL